MPNAENSNHSLALLAVALSAVLIAATSMAANAACCYFAAKDKDINQPGQKAFISWNPTKKTEAFTVQPKFEGNATDFGMVIPTPARPKLDEMPRDFFKNLAIYTILMPLPQPIYSPLEPMPEEESCCDSLGSMRSKGIQLEGKKRPAVRVLEAGVVGSLDYKIIVADEATALFSWLKSNKYTYSGDEATLQFYIKKKWFFTVMKIDPKQMKKAANGSYLGEVTPTRFTFNSTQCIYPLKITQISVKDKTDALFYVHSPDQMDLANDWSWMHSYRPMYLTYMLGCGADPSQREELDRRTKWVNEKKAANGDFETTKLEWAKRLTEADISVLEDPLKNYGQMGGGDLPPGSKAIALQQFLSQIKAEFLKTHGGKMTDYATSQLASLSDSYQPSKGAVVQNDEKLLGKSSFVTTKYTWYPAREVPQDDQKTLSLLKGHLQKGMWLTKFRKIVRKSEMNNDLILAAVPAIQEQTYTRIMPTSPP